MNTTNGQHLAHFFEVMAEYCSYQPLYVPQPHDWVYGSPLRPMRQAWACIPNTQYISSDVQETGMHSLVIASQELSPEIIARYELVLIQRPDTGPGQLPDNSLASLEQRVLASAHGELYYCPKGGMALGRLSTYAEDSWSLAMYAGEFSGPTLENVIEQGEQVIPDIRQCLAEFTLD